MLDIDAQKATEVLEKYIRDLLIENNRECVVLGISGGIDSAVLAALAVRGVGPDRVRGYFLKDRDSDKNSEKKAREIAQWLGMGHRD